MSASHPTQISPPVSLRRDGHPFRLDRCKMTSLMAKVLSCAFLQATLVDSFAPTTPIYSFLPPHTAAGSQTRPTQHSKFAARTLNKPLFMIFAPPGSGYATADDEESALPDTYDPMMEYPGTMRPGRTPENMPYSDLPMGDDDPDPVPWPHFQQIEWHHKWEPPHPHPIPMEQFIEMNGRWATPEMEAAMRAGVRRDVRQRQEQEAEDRRDMIITDDDDEDDFGSGDGEEPISLGDGMFGQLGSDADAALTAAAVAPPPKGAAGKKTETDEDTAGGTDDDEDDLDSFLLDLGLDADMGLDDDGEEGEKDDDDDLPADSTPRMTKLVDMDDEVTITEDDGEDDDEGASAGLGMTSDGGDVTATINVDDDDDMDLGLDDDDEMGDDGVSTVPLDDFGDNDNIDGEDVFDDGGFDYDDGDFDGGGDDIW